MAFLDNTGDIILDAVLTDTGRKRLAKGDGSFNIDRFALGDDEIDYSLYENSNHATVTDGASSTWDLNIMMTPILEAFTNNTSSMKSKLISYVRDNFLYLPVLRLNNIESNVKKHAASGTYVVAVDANTVSQWTTSGTLEEGALNGLSPDGNRKIRVDQGLDTTSLAFNDPLDEDLRENQYIIQIDDRLGKIVGSKGLLSVSYIDDDNIASYYVNFNGGSGIVGSHQAATTTEITNSGNEKSAVAGPRGTKLEFRIRASSNLTTSANLMTTIGNAATVNAPDATTDYRYIDANVRITGATTGASIDIPVRFVKKT